MICVFLKLRMIWDGTISICLLTIKNAGKPFYEISLSLNCKALVFTGITIMSQPPLVTIILINKGKATVVYNKPSYLNSITENTTKTILNLQLNTVEYDLNDKPYNKAELATLTFKDGMIYYYEEQ